MARQIDKTLDRFQSKARDRQERERGNLQVNDLKWLMQTAQGRRIVYRVLERCHCFASIFSENASLMAHNAGWQDAGFWLMGEVSEASQFHYYQMIKEHAASEDRAAIEVLEEAEAFRKKAADSGEDTDL